MSSQVVEVYSTNILKNIELVSRLIKTKEEYHKYVNYLRKTILILNKCVKNRSDRVKSFNKIESDLSMLKKYLQNVKPKFGEIKYLKNKELIWQDVESCFKGRIKTGVITNLKIKSPNEFLKKAFRSFSLRIKKEVRTSLLKVNVVFAGLFVKPRNAETSFKYFSTKNGVIDQNTNLNEWYL
jgi:hypothetical protein